MKKWFLVAFLSLLPALASALTLVEGKDYTVLANPTVAPAKGQVEVAEFFWYGCPHCYSLEPYVATWLKTKPANVKFTRIPAALNPVWEANARGYYVAEASGVLEASHAALARRCSPLVFGRLASCHWAPYASVCPSPAKLKQPMDALAFGFELGYPRENARLSQSSFG